MRSSKPGIKPGTLASTGFSSSIYFYFSAAGGSRDADSAFDVRAFMPSLEPCSYHLLRNFKNIFFTVTDDIQRGTGTYWHIPIYYISQPIHKLRVLILFFEHKRNQPRALAVLYHCVRANTLSVDLF